MATLKTLRIADFSRDIPTYSAGDGIEISDSGVISAVVSDLSNYYTKDETYSKEEVNDLIETINEFELVEVDELPATGDAKKLYLVPKEDGSSPDVKEEYVWLSTNAWEKIGETKIDLTNYYTKSEVDNLLDAKQDTLTAGDNITIASDGTISATDTTYENATTTEAGLMSSEDKTKLDGIDWTKAGILEALGYEEIEISMTDTDGTVYTKTIISKIDE